MGQAVVFYLVAAVCLAVAMYLIYLQLPRGDRPVPAWLASESGSTTAAMGTFILLVAGIALLFKGSMLS